METLFQTIGMQVVTFIVGIIIGFAMGYKVAHAKKTEGNLLKTMVTTAIFMIWSASVILDVYRGAANTPLFLHLFMGTVLGAMNHEFGEWLLKLINRNK